VEGLAKLHMSSALALPVKYAPPPPPPLFSLRGHEGAVNAVCFVGDGNYLVSGDVDGKVKVWSLEGRNAVAELDNVHAHSVISVVRVLDAEGHFATCSRDATVKIWNLETCHSGGAPMSVLQTQARCFCNASADIDSPSCDKNLLITAGAEESAVQLWDLRTASVVSVMLMPQEQGIVSSLLLKTEASPGPLAFVGCDDGSLSCVDLRLNSILSRVKLHEDEVGPQPLLTIAAQPLATDGALRLLTGGGDCKLRRSGYNGSVLEAQDCATLPSVGTSSISVRCDGRLIASGHWDKTVRLYDAKRLKPLAVLHHHKESVFGLGFGIRGTASQGLLASSSKDGLIALWDILAGTMKD